MSWGEVYEYNRDYKKEKLDIKSNSFEIYQFINNCINNKLIYYYEKNGYAYIFFESEENEKYNYFEICSYEIKYSLKDKLEIDKSIIFNKLKSNNILNKIDYMILLHFIEIYLNSIKKLTKKIINNINSILEELVESEIFLYYKNIVTKVYILQLIKDENEPISCDIYIRDGINIVSAKVYLDDDIKYISGIRL